jgi:hypothetical protein
MAQIFHPSTNTISKVSIFGAVFIVAGLLWVAATVQRSSYMTGVNVARDQPVQFSHEHHVSGLGIDCRYCHSTVETSAFAGIPPTKTCMTCHSQIWVDSPYLEPVRQSYRSDRSLEWTRVHNLADFVYFDHSIHLKKGIGCESCHGRVDKMQLMSKANTLHMEWCLECHREPERFVRPRDQLYTMGWVPEEDQRQLGPRLVQEHKIQSLTYCSTCHR